MDKYKSKIVIIGAGPAGLSAAYELARHNVLADCIEATGDIGGMCRTIEYKGYRFDLGGHGFSTNNKEIYELWCNLLGDDFIKHSHATSIYYKHNYFNFPPGLTETLNKLGLLECFKISIYLLIRQLIPIKNASTLEDVTKNNFGDYFYECFVKEYMTKVWGTPCHLLVPEASVTVYNIKLLNVLKRKFFNKNKTAGGSGYPRYGAGQMFDAMHKRAEENGIDFRQNCRVVKIILDSNRINSVVIETPIGEDQIPLSHLLSSMPLKDLVMIITPKLSDSALAAASKLGYRSLIIVNLILESNIDIPFGCINIQDPLIKLSRLHCFKNWSIKMVPDETRCSLECEYFVEEDCDLWRSSDENVINMTKDELKQIGLISTKDVVEGFVVRIPKAYPLLTTDYTKLIKIIYAELDGIDNLQLIGRGMHSYESMHHAILTGLLGSRRILGGRS